jgi:PKD repeat protein
MFTNGQKNRMLAAANSSTAGRNNLWSANNLVATGVSTTSVTPCAPIADFRANATSVCSNSNITFTDLSYNADVDGTWNWNWSFPGGTPSSSSQQNPVVSYAQPGTYTATLTVSNSAGNNSVTKTSYLLVSTSTPTLVSPVIEGFETASFPQNNVNDATQNWRYESSVNNAFSRTNLTSASGSACLKYNNLQVAEGTNSSVISPVIDFSSVTSPTSITFKVAYARRSVATNDKLEVWISSNCGQTWTRRYAKLGSTLATTSTLVTSSYTPSSTEWRTESVSVTPLAGEEHGMVKFTVIDSSGNNLYLDDINLVNTPAGLSEVLDEYSTQVFPNPGSGDAQINIGLFKPEEISVSILDVTGRLLGTKKLGMKSSSEHTIWLHDLSGSHLASGAYFIRIEAGNQTMIRKWIGN